MEKLEFPQVVELNVGGRHLTTSLDTLTKYPDSMLAAMFSGTHHVTQDKDGRFFIDVDGDVFVHVLNFLRLQTMPPPDKVSEVQKYAEYFALENFSKRLTKVVPLWENSVFESWASNFPDYTECLKSVKQQLKTCQIHDGYFSLEIVNINCCNSLSVKHGHWVSYDKIPRFKGIRYAEIRVYRKLKKANDTLISVLAHDLKQVGFYMVQNLPCWSNKCCVTARMFTVE